MQVIHTSVIRQVSHVYCIGFVLAWWIVSPKWLFLLYFLSSKIYFLETVGSVAVLGFADIVAGVGDGFHNGPDAVAAVVGCEFLLNKRFWAFGLLCFE